MIVSSASSKFNANKRSVGANSCIIILYDAKYCLNCLLNDLTPDFYTGGLSKIEIVISVIVENIHPIGRDFKKNYVFIRALQNGILRPDQTSVLAQFFATKL